MLTPNTIWKSLISFVILSFSTGAWISVFYIIPITLSLENKSVELGKIYNADFISEKSSQNDLHVILETTELETDKLAKLGGWIWGFGPAFVWIPTVEHEISYWSIQSKRLALNVRSARSLLKASSELIDTYDQAQNNFVFKTIDPENYQNMNIVTENTDLLLTSGFDSLSGAIKLGKDYKPYFSFYKTDQALEIMDHTEKKLATYYKIGTLASSLMIDLIELGDETSSVLSLLSTETNQDKKQSVQDLKITLYHLDNRLRFAHSKTKSLSSIIVDSDINTSLNNRVYFIQDVLKVLIDINNAMQFGLNTLDPVLENDSKEGVLGNNGKLTTILETAVENRDDLTRGLELLRKTELDINTIESNRQYSFGNSVTNQLANTAKNLRNGIELIINLIPIGPELIGTNSIKRYLVLGQSADELRATGGFVSSVWLITIENGKILDTRYHDAVRVDDWERLELYPPAPVGLETHINAHVWLLRDVSWDPDFPTTAQTAIDMYRLGQRQNVDGVIALNQWALLNLIQGFGEIPSPNDANPMTHRNLLTKLEEGTDKYGRAYIDLALQGILDTLEKPTSPTALIRLASSIQSSFESKDLLVYMKDPAHQSVIKEIGWDGGVKNERGDYIYVVDSNVGWSKSDRHIERKIEYLVDLRKSPKPRVNLTIGYKNHSGPTSPSCEPQWAHRGTDYSQLKNACYWNYWRVYVPFGSKLLSSTKLQLPKHSVAAQIGKGTPGENSIKISANHNKTIYSGLIDIEAGESRKSTSFMSCLTVRTNTI